MNDSLLVFEVWRNEDLLYISRSSPFVKMYFAPESPTALEQIRTATHWVVYLEKPGEPKSTAPEHPMFRDTRVFPSDWMAIMPDLLRLIDCADTTKVPCGQTLGHGESCVTGHLCPGCEHIVDLENIINHIHQKMT